MELATTEQVMGDLVVSREVQEMIECGIEEQRRCPD